MKKMDTVSTVKNAGYGILRKICICVVIIAIAVLVDYLVQNYIYKSEYNIIDDKTCHIFQIDKMEFADNEMVLTGWVFRVMTDALTDDFDIILYDYKNDNEYYMNVVDEVRADVNEYFDCECDYSESGFVADISIDRLNLRENDYEVLIRQRNTKNVYKTGNYISDGELIYVEPDDYEPIVVIDEELKEIVDKGILRVYRPDVGMYVYQYEGKLYWIANNDYMFEDDGSTYMQYQLWTMNTAKLPEYRLENNWFFDNIGFNFEDNELETMQNDYRVASTLLPTEYPITTIEIGYYVNDTWIWVEHFRPWYEFD